MHIITAAVTTGLSMLPEQTYPWKQKAITIATIVNSILFYKTIWSMPKEKPDLYSLVTLGIILLESSAVFETLGVPSKYNFIRENFGDIPLPAPNPHLAPTKQYFRLCPLSHVAKLTLLLHAIVEPTLSTPFLVKLTRTALLTIFTASFQQKLMIRQVSRTVLPDNVWVDVMQEVSLYTSINLGKMKICPLCNRQMLSGRVQASFQPNRKSCHLDCAALFNKGRLRQVVTHDDTWLSHIRFVDPDNHTSSTSLLVHLSDNPYPIDPTDKNAILPSYERVEWCLLADSRITRHSSILARAALTDRGDLTPRSVPIRAADMRLPLAQRVP